MEIELSWDIVFVAFLIVAFGALFLRSHKFGVRLLLGTYLSLILAEGLSFFIENIILPAAPTLQNWVSEQEILVFMILRLMIFGAGIVLFLARDHYKIEHKAHDHWLARTIIHILFTGIISLLIVGSIFAFLSGNSVIEATLSSFAPNAWFDESLFITPVLQLFGLWLVLPALGIVVISIIGPRD